MRLGVDSHCIYQCDQRYSVLQEWVCLHIIIVCRIEDIGFSTLNCQLTYMHVVSNIELYHYFLFLPVWESLPLSQYAGRVVSVA